ncbi:AAA family ATPase [Streptomyces tricolor]|nr:AAA family ATPase [Streptomyces tricolor]
MEPRRDRSSPRSSAAKARATGDPIPRRVLGREAAVAMTLDILKRPLRRYPGPSHRPGTSRAGCCSSPAPTGYRQDRTGEGGVASVLFDNDQAYLRRAGSRQVPRAAHSADRPRRRAPGYVGYEAGGELTPPYGRTRSASSLFDEIEKADKGILDKFLQAGGRQAHQRAGVTTYFSECVLIFTSNPACSARTRRPGNARIVEPGTPYRELEAHRPGQRQEALRTGHRSPRS